jgi:hypothetical protein
VGEAVAKDSNEWEDRCRLSEARTDALESELHVGATRLAQEIALLKLKIQEQVLHHSEYARLHMLQDVP